jgi:chorismate dehydratase
VALEDIGEVMLDYQSLTSVNLIRVLFAFYWKHQVQFVDAKPGFEDGISGHKAALVIGDRTFALNGKFPFEWDLASEWKKFTGMPFVFAAWVSNTKLPLDFTTEFNRVLKTGVENIKSAVESDLVPEFLSATEACEYLTHRISYRFDESKRAAMESFFDYLKKLKTGSLETAS